jgi:hypothetical protein
MKRISLLLAASFVLALLATASLAQTGRSSVKGTVKDPQGNVVVGASVTLSNPETNFTRTTTTGGGGRMFAEIG